MARKAKELSAMEVGRLTAVGHHAVGGVAGLYLYVVESGARSWVLRTMVGGKRRHMGLGGFPEVTLAKARDKARAAKEQVSHGVDPIAQRLAVASSLKAQQAMQKTFREAALAYVDAHSQSWDNPKHRAQWVSTLENYAFPHIGNLLVQDVEQEQVLKVLEPIWATKTETASRLRGRIESVLDWATVRKYRTGDNPARWRGHLDQLLAAPKKIQKVKHHRALPASQLADFMKKLRARPGTGARALEFAIYCAARSGEVRGAQWSEMDMKSAVWKIPAERMKAKKEHRVPLSPSALSLLKSLPKGADSDFVFASSKGGLLSDMTLTLLMRRMEVDAVPHGFRSTFRDWVSESTDYPRELAEQALAHVIESKVEAAYRRGDALEKRRKMMVDWAGLCDGK